MVQLASAVDTVNNFIDSRGVLGALLVAGITTGAGLWWRGRRPFREISWSEEYDQPLNQSVNGDQIASFWNIQFEGADVQDGSLVLLRVRNTGTGSIDADDFVSRLSFDFPGRQVVGYKVRDNPLVHEQVETAREKEREARSPQEKAREAQEIARKARESARNADEKAAKAEEAAREAEQALTAPDTQATVQLHSPAAASGGPATTHAGTQAAAPSGGPTTGEVSRSQQPATEPAALSRFALPGFASNPGTEFRLLVLLQGGPKTGPVGCDGQIKDGRIVHHSVRRPPLRLIAVGASLAVMIAGVTLGVRLANDARTPTASCASGQLTLQGSSAFAPVVNQVRNSYRQLCGNGATITITADGSDRGLGDLERSHSSNTIAMSDGLPASALGTAGMTRRPVGVVSFAVVVNTGLRGTLPDLFTAQGISADELRALFSGGSGAGALAPNLVAVGRTHASGTRSAFAGAFFGGTDPEPQNAPACGPTTRVGFCVSNNTMDLLSFVDSHPNAIGYAEADALPYFPNVQVVAVDGQTPSAQSVGSGAYPFVATEYLYTADRPAGLVADFLDFLTSPAEIVALRGHGFLACSDLHGTKLDGACDG